MTDIKKAAAGLRAIQKLFAPLADIQEIIDAAEGAEFAAQAADKRRADAEARRAEAETATTAALQRVAAAEAVEEEARGRANIAQAQILAAADQKAQAILAGAAADGARLVDEAKAKVAAIEAELEHLESLKITGQKEVAKLTAEADEKRKAIEAMRESAKALLG